MNLINMMKMALLWIEYFLDLFANTFKSMFNGDDYDEFYYQSKSLIEQINDIKIILNILRDRDIDE